MRRAGQWIHTMLLTASVVSALADLTVAQAAASHSPSPDLVSSTLVLRGSAASPEQVAAASDRGAPTVLRGSPPSAAQPHASPYSCNPGLYFDPNYGCVAPGFSYFSDNGYWADYGYWPGLGLDTGRGRRGFRHGFAHRVGRGRPYLFGAAFAHTGVSHSFPRAAGFGRR